MIPARLCKCRPHHTTLPRILGALQLRPMRGIELASVLCISRDLVRRTLSPKARKALGVEFIEEYYHAPRQL